MNVRPEPIANRPRYPALPILFVLALAFAGLAAPAMSLAQSYVGEITAPDLGGMAPTAIAIDRTLSPEILYVADEGSGRILKYNAATGARIAVLGAAGFGDGEFNRPYGIAIDPATRDLYVAERGNGRVQRVTNTGAFVMKWGEHNTAANTPQGYFNEPIGIAADSDGYVYVVDRGNNRIQKFLVTPSGNAWQVQNVAMWGTTGSAPGQLDRPYGIVLDPAGTLWVAEANNHRVQRFSNAGTSLQIVGGAGSGPGQFALPVGVGIDGNGALYVAETNTDPQNTSLPDINQQRVQRFTSTGDYDGFSWGGSYGSGPGQFRLPFGIALGSESRAYVTDYYNQRVQIFDLATAPTPPGPQITSAPTAAGTVGQEFTYQITADRVVTNYGATGLAPGLAVNPGTGAITGTPSSSGQFQGTISATNSSGTGTSSFTMDIQPSAPTSLWLTQDVGAVAAVGSASESGGVVTVRGSGADIWERADEFRYRYQTFSGDGEIVARLTALDHTHGWAKAGVMFRETLTTGSRQVFMCISAANGSAFQHRPATGGDSLSTAGAWVSAPRWVRIVRSGDTFTGYQSDDGATWSQVGSVVLALPASLQAGLAVTSHNDGVIATATFDHVAVTATGSTTPPATPAAPTTLSATAASPTQVNLGWTDQATNETSFQLERSTDGVTFAPMATPGTNATTYTDPTVSGATSYHYRIRAFNGTAASGYSNVATVTTPPATTGATWQHADVGAVGIAGSDDAAGNTITVRGSGADIWENADGFRFLYQALRGDCQVEAQVFAVGNTNGWAKAGVMIRESLAANAPNVFACVTPANGLGVQVRATAGGATTFTPGPWGASAPYWVRLVRTGNVIVASISTDGVTWTPLSTTTVTMGADVLVGFAVTSHNNAVLNTSTFSDPFIQ